MDYYLEEMSWNDVKNALSSFDMGEEQYAKLMSWVWEKERKPFEVF